MMSHLESFLSTPEMEDSDFVEPSAWSKVARGLALMSSQPYGDRKPGDIAVTAKSTKYHASFQRNSV